MVFTKQWYVCSICGNVFSSYPLRDQPALCSGECRREWGWVHTLGVMGREWYPDPKAAAGYYDNYWDHWIDRASPVPEGE